MHGFFLNFLFSAITLDENGDIIYPGMDNHMVVMEPMSTTPVSTPVL